MYVFLPQEEDSALNKTKKTTCSETTCSDSDSFKQLPAMDWSQKLDAFPSLQE
jgi:hypothetical protein